MSQSTIMDPFSTTKICPLDLKIIFPIHKNILFLSKAFNVMR